MNMREKKRFKGRNLRERTRRLLAVFLCVCMMLTMMPITAKAEVTASGTCGAAGNEGNVTWTLDTEGKLTISGSGAMKDCSSVNDVPWYRYRKSITSVEIVEGVTSISSSAFFETGITSITIPASVTTIGNTPFHFCTSLESILVAEGNTSYLSEDGILFDKGKTTLIAYPAKKEGTYDIPASVTVIKDRAFAFSGLTSITIPTGVISIGECAFAGSGLTSIRIPASVTTIEMGSFWNCISLTSVTFADNSQLTTFGDEYTFSGCTSLESVSFGNNSQLTTIGDRTFQELTSLESVSFGENSQLATIGERAFYECTNLKNITIPASVSSIGAYAFYSTNLTDITIPAGVTLLDSGVFDSCTNLTSITFADNSELTSIDSYAFQNCESLTSITLPAKVTIINVYNTFQGCKSLKCIDVDKNSETYSSIDGVLYNKSGTELLLFPSGSDITSYEFPNSVQSIGQYAFYYNTGLTSVVIPNTVTSIGGYAFYHCTGLTSVDILTEVTSIPANTFAYCFNLKSVNIPNSVQSIGTRAFYYCTGLTSVVIPTEVTSVGKNAFAYCDNLTSIFLPSAATVETTSFPDTATKVKYTVSDGKVTISEIADGQTVLVKLFCNTLFDKYLTVTSLHRC